VQAKGRFFAALYAFEARNELERRVAMLRDLIAALEKIQNDLLNKMPYYRFVAETLVDLVRRAGVAETKEVANTIFDILMMPCYKSNPDMLVNDLNRLIRERWREEQLRIQRQESQKLFRQKQESNVRPPQPAPALPERIPRKDEVSDQGGKEGDTETAATDGKDDNQKVGATNANEQRQQRQDSQENGSDNS
jgi:hypothetical protein